MSNTEVKTLSFGISPIIVALVFAVFSIVAISGSIVQIQSNEGTEKITIAILLAINFTIIAIYLISDRFKVKGQYDDKIIFFHTPWTGTKQEKWEDLVSLTFNKRYKWYKLTFKSGAIIRFANGLKGQYEAIDSLVDNGWEVKETNSIKDVG